MKNEQKILLELIKLGIGKSSVFNLPPSINWPDIFWLVEKQKVSAIAFDGIIKCFENNTEFCIDFHTKMEWIGLVQKIEAFYRRHEKNMRQLAHYYSEHGIKMMVIKGYGLSQNYPIPTHRTPGDIDIYLFGDQKKGDLLLQNEYGVAIDKSHHHHTVFSFQEDLVENHYDFLNVHVRKSNKRMEEKLKKLAQKSQEVDGIYYPTVEFNAIYLLRHCAAHFASTNMSVRQILDWGFFMEKHHKEIDWGSYIPYVKAEGMYRFYNLIGLFCIKHLGFDASFFHELSEDALLDRFSNEILSPEFKDRENGKLLHSLSVKPRRWWHNRWKNRLCYPDSTWSEFTCGLWAKVLKPTHFIQ